MVSVATEDEAANAPPLVSVVMPMKDAEPYVQQALASVLRESAIPLEVIVVDDGSTDRSREIVQGFADPRVRILDGPRRGFPASVNTGLLAARGEIVMQCDADDLYPPERIAQQVAWLRDHHEHEAVCGSFNPMGADGRTVLVLDAEQGAITEVDAELRRGVTRTSLCTYAIRRSALSRVGVHREYFETSSDIDLQLRLGEACRIAYLPQNTYFYRLHDASITHTQGSARRVFYESMAHEFQRQRMTTGLDDLVEGRPPAPPERLRDAAGKSARQLQGMLIGQAWRSLAMNDRPAATAAMKRAVAADPANLAAWVSAAKLAVRFVVARRGPRRSGCDES